MTTSREGADDADHRAAEDGTDRTSDTASNPAGDPLSESRRAAGRARRRGPAGGRVVGFALFLVGLGTLSSILVAAVLFVSSITRAVGLVVQVVGGGRFGTQAGIETLILAAVEQADLILIAAALMIIGVGMFELFIGDVMRLPAWLHVDSLEQLKDKLVSVIVAGLAVNFYTHVVEWTGDSTILYLGAGIGLVVISLAGFGGLHARRSD